MMGTRITNYLALASCTIILAVGQILLKFIGLQLRGDNPLGKFVGLLGHAGIYTAFFFYALAMMLWLWILSRVPLAQAYPWVASAVAIVPLLSIFIFHEHVQSYFWFGVGLIMIGIVITQAAAA